jgi:hypothetical protein
VLGDSYTATSPSGTGVKILFTVKTEDLPVLRKAVATDTGCKKWHAAVATIPRRSNVCRQALLYSDGEHVDATPAELRRVNLEALLWLINEHGPAFAATTGTRAPQPTMMSG